MSDVLSSVRKMEASLKRLKQARRTAAASPVGPSGGMSDDDKIRLQLALDVEYLGEQVLELPQHQQPRLGSQAPTGTGAPSGAVAEARTSIPWLTRGESGPSCSGVKDLHPGSRKEEAGECQEFPPMASRAGSYAGCRCDAQASHAWEGRAAQLALTCSRVATDSTAVPSRGRRKGADAAACFPPGWCRLSVKQS